MAREYVLHVPGALSTDRARASLAAQSYGVLSPSRLLRAARTDQLRGIEQVLVPTWLFGTDVATTLAKGRRRTAHTTVRLAVDALSGECRVVPDGATADESDATYSLHTRVPGRLAADEAERRALDAMRWQTIRSGRIHLRDLRISAGGAQLVQLPTWLGYFADGRGRVRVRCLNAMDGTVENAVYAIRILRGLGQAEPESESGPGSVPEPETEPGPGSVPESESRPRAASGAIRTASGASSRRTGG